MLAASAEPSRRALCCTAVVKKEEEFTSSQRSNLKKKLECEQKKRRLALRKVDKRRLIPVLRNIVKIEFNDWPQSICQEGNIAVAQEPVCVGNQCCRT
jgi:hypothetical protein